jgi:hypothetical protein
MPQPLFIIGNPRSGTSLLRLMLTCHDDICIAPECHFFLWLEEKYSLWDENGDLKQYLIDLAASKKFETWEIDMAALEKYILQKRPRNYSELTECVYVFYAIKMGKENIKFWGDKNKLWKEKLPKVLHYFPNTRYIHLVRDGRDVACSFLELNNKKFTSKYAPKLPGKIEDIAIRWGNNIIRINKFFETLNPGNFIEIKYEELVLNFKETVTRALAFLNLQFDPKIENYYIINSELKLEPDEIMAWKTKLNTKPDALNINKYRTILTAEQIKTFNEICAPELKRYGYGI